MERPPDAARPVPDRARRPGRRDRPGADAARRQGPRPRSRRRPQRLVAPLRGDGRRARRRLHRGRASRSGCCATGTAAGTAASGAGRRTPGGRWRRCGASSATCRSCCSATRWARGRRSRRRRPDGPRRRRARPVVPRGRAGRRAGRQAAGRRPRAPRPDHLAARDPRLRRPRAGWPRRREYVDMGRVGHYMLRRAAAWNEFALDASLSLLDRALTRPRLAHRVCETKPFRSMVRTKQFRSIRQECPMVPDTDHRPAPRRGRPRAGDPRRDARPCSPRSATTG